MKTDNELIAEFMGWNKDSAGLWLIPNGYAETVKEPEKIESQDELWRDAREELIIFIRDNEERILSMPTSMAFDIINFLKSKFHISHRIKPE